MTNQYNCIKNPISLVRVYSSDVKEGHYSRGAIAMEQNICTILSSIGSVVAIIIVIAILVLFGLFAFKIFSDIQNPSPLKIDSVVSFDNIKHGSSNVDKPSNYDKEVNSIRNKLVKEYYQMSDDILILTKIYIEPRDVLHFFENKCTFPCQSNFECTVTRMDDFNKIEVSIEYSQGSKIFFAVRDNRLYEKLNEQDKLVYDKINKIYSSITRDCKSDMERELRIHDYLISTSRYDHENLEKGTIPPESYTPYGILFNHVAVCKAYAETFMIFMQLANIECHFIVGDTKNSHYNNPDLLHAWNIVKINGKYMHVDVTFDNPVPYTIGRIDHTYFNVSDEIMKRTHVWSTSHYPECK